MTRMALQKRQLLSDAIKNIKALRSLTGNNSQVVTVQDNLESLKVLL